MCIERVEAGLTTKLGPLTPGDLAPADDGKPGGVVIDGNTGKKAGKGTAEEFMKESFG